MSVHEARIGRVVDEGEAGEEGDEGIQYPVWIVAPDAPRIPPENCAALLAKLDLQCKKVQ